MLNVCLTLSSLGFHLISLDAIFIGLIIFGGVLLSGFCSLNLIRGFTNSVILFLGFVFYILSVKVPYSYGLGYARIECVIQKLGVPGVKTLLFPE